MLTGFTWSEKRLQGCFPPGHRKKVRFCGGRSNFDLIYEGSVVSLG